MRSILCGLVVVVVGCGTNNVPVVNGKDGAQGPVGATGPAGPQGPQGAPGGALANINAVPAGSACAAGGISVVQADGGTNYVCNAAPGSMGATGATGPAGAAGAPGPMGPAGPSVSIYDANNALLGQVLSSPFDGEMSGVYLKAQGCIAQLDYSTNKIVAWNGRIHYTGPGCTGTAFIQRDSGAVNFPLTCIGAGNQAVKAVQPMMVQQINGMSSYYIFSTSTDGGETIGCFDDVETGVYGVPAQPVTMPAMPGPFTFGMP